MVSRNLSCHVTTCLLQAWAGPHFAWACITSLSTIFRNRLSPRLATCDIPGIGFAFLPRRRTLKRTVEHARNCWTHYAEAAPVGGTAARANGRGSPPRI